MGKGQWLLVVLVAMLAGGCGGSGSDKSPPVLKNLVVVFDEYPTGDFVLSPSGKVFLEFGAVVLDGGGQPKILPTFEYRVHEDALVVSPMDGRVTRVEYQSGSNDYTIWLQPSQNSVWLVEIDHVRDPEVLVGDTVMAGDLLGMPGTWGGGLGRVELMVNRGNAHHCPFNVFDPGLIDAYRAQVTALMNAAEAANTTGSDFYDQAAMPEPGCNALSYASDEL